MEDAFGANDTSDPWVWKDAHETVEITQILSLSCYGALMRRQAASTHLGLQPRGNARPAARTCFAPRTTSRAVRARGAAAVLLQAARGQDRGLLLRQVPGDDWSDPR